MSALRLLLRVQAREEVIGVRELFADASVSGIAHQLANSPSNASAAKAEVASKSADDARTLELIRLRRGS